MGLVRKDQLITEAPLATTVTRTNPSGMITSTNATHISTVTMRLLVRRQPAGSRRSLLPLGSDGHQAPLLRRAERATTPRATRLMMIVITNRSTPIPNSPALNTPVASPNWFAMTAGKL